MIAEFDTRCGEGYALSVEVLPEGAPGDFFAPARAAFEGTIAWLESASAAGMAHADLEERLQIDVRELTRLGLQGHLDLRAEQEVRVAVSGAEGVRRGCMEAGRRRPLLSVFGPVVVSRNAYRAKGHANLCPADALLNLPAEQHSHGLRRVSAIEAARGSYDETRRSRRSSARPARSWASVKSSSSPSAPRSISTASTRLARPPGTVVTRWSSRVTARAW